MNSKFISIVSAISAAQAAWGLGFCSSRAPPEMQGFSPKKFEGHWYEIQRDTDHNFWSNQKCTEDFYTASWTGDLSLERSYLTKLFGIE